MKKAADVRKELQSMADPEKAAILQRSFKTGLGQYGEGDIFIFIAKGQCIRKPGFGFCFYCRTGIRR
jgi:hypothetical protein